MYNHSTPEKVTYDSWQYVENFIDMIQSQKEFFLLLLLITTLCSQLLFEK